MVSILVGNLASGITYWIILRSLHLDICNSFWDNKRFDATIEIAVIEHRRLHRHTGKQNSS